MGFEKKKSILNREGKLMEGQGPRQCSGDSHLESPPYL